MDELDGNSEEQEATEQSTENQEAWGNYEEVDLEEDDISWGSTHPYKK